MKQKILQFKIINNALFLDGRKGEWLFRLEESDGLRSAAAQCNSWLSEQNKKVYIKFNRANPCPQNWWQARWDRS
mgnify:CR=1 FL=1